MTNNINQAEESTVKPRALLLGMIYSEEYRPKRGQGNAKDLFTY